MVATPGLAHAEGDEPGDPGPAATGEEQVLANETTTDGEPGSPNDPEAEAQPAVLETSGEVRESNTIQQGSSPAVVISSSGGSHNAEDEDEARPVSRQDNSSTPITGAVQPNSPGSVPPALAGPSLMQMNVAHPPGHGGGDPAPAPAPAATPPSAPLGPTSQLVMTLAHAIQPMMAGIAPNMDPVLYAYAYLLGYEGAPTGDLYGQIVGLLHHKLQMEATAQTCKANPSDAACASTHAHEVATGPLPTLVSQITTAMNPMMTAMSPTMDPILLAYLALLGDQKKIYGPHGVHMHPGMTTFEQITATWTAKLDHEEAMHEMKLRCQADGSRAECHAGHGDGGHGNHGGGGSSGPMGAMSMMAMMAMMAMPKMPEMTHGDCMGGTFLMCNQGAGAETTYNDHDVMFLNHMIPHHGQAVLMSRIVLGKDDLDPRVAALAEQIKAAQGPEIRLMESWLDSWGNPPSDMVGDHGILPPKDILALRQANGADASVLFLQQMTYHHKGAVDASIGHLMGGQFDPSLKLASDIIGAQNVEIQTMSDLLASLGAPETGANVPVAPSGGQPLQPSGGGSSSGSGGHHH